MTEELEGVVENLLFASEDSGYSVVRLRSGGQLVTVVGNLATTVPGERLHLKGRWTDHPRFGRQFRDPWDADGLPTGKPRSGPGERRNRPVDPWAEGLLCIDRTPPVIDALSIHPRQALDLPSMMKGERGWKEQVVPLPTTSAIELDGSEILRLRVRDPFGAGTGFVRRLTVSIGDWELYSWDAASYTYGITRFAGHAFPHRRRRRREPQEHLDRAPLPRPPATATRTR